MTVQKKVPVMLHRALFGSLERFIGILIEHYAGKLPLWLAPLKAVVIPIASEFDNYAKNIFEQMMKAGINTEVDLKNQKINYKIREHSLAKVPLLLICGEKEVKNNSITIRRLGSDKQETVPLNESIKNISNRLGHSDISTTMNIYAKARPGVDSSYLEKANVRRA